MRWFFVIWTVLMVLIYYYLGIRLIKPAKLTPRQKRFSWAAIAFIPVTQIVSFVIRQSTDNGIMQYIFSWISYAGFGFISLILAGLIIRDLGLTCTRLFAGIQKFILRNKGGPKPFDVERRRFLINATNLGIMGASALFTGYGIYEARRQPILEKIEVPIDNLPPGLEGFTIAQFTDIHAGNTIKRNFIQSAVDQVNDLKADTIVFTGDLVDGTVKKLRNDVQPLKELTAPHGVFYITGNHEYYSDGGAEPWIEEMDRLGLIVLINENKIIEHNNSILFMAGVTDYRAGSIYPPHRSDPKKAMAGAPEDAIKILLAHQPKSILGASANNVDLQLSGHTHGGQYFPWNFLVTIDQPYISGLHKYKKTWIYVNRGTGYWGPPIRLGIPSEVTLITLVSANLAA